MGVTYRLQSPVKERIAKLREEIAQISDANRLYFQGGKKLYGAAGDHERRLRRLQEILDKMGGAHRLEKNYEQAVIASCGSARIGPQRRNPTPHALGAIPRYRSMHPMPSQGKGSRLQSGCYEPSHKPIR